MVIIVGGSGFIGSRLAERLESSRLDFRIIDKSPSDCFPERTIRADVRNRDELEAALIAAGARSDSTLFNLAAEHRDDVKPVSLYHEVNVLGAQNLCEAADRLLIRRVVFASSVAVYGFAPIGTDESGEMRPYNNYGRTKSEAEKVYRAWQAADSARSLVIVRPTVVFGEGNRGNVYNLFRQIAAGRFIMIGNGRNKKSMAYVENVAAFFQSLIGAPSGAQTYNYVDKPDYSMNELVTVVEHALGKRSPTRIRLPVVLGYVGGIALDCLSAITRRSYPVSAVRVRKFIANTVFGSSRVPSTGFSPPVALRDAIVSTVNHEFMNKAGLHPGYQEGGSTT